MIVAELINKLEQMPMNYEVVANDALPMTLNQTPL